MAITIRLDALAQIVTSEGSEKQSRSFPISDKLITAMRFQNFPMAAGGTKTISITGTTKPRLVFVKPDGIDLYVGIKSTSISTYAPKIPDGFPYLAWHTGSTKIYLKNPSATLTGEIEVGMWVASTTTTD
jgi:hypothetical protein